MLVAGAILENWEVVTAEMIFVVELKFWRLMPLEPFLCSVFYYVMTYSQLWKTESSNKFSFHIFRIHASILTLMHNYFLGMFPVFVPMGVCDEIWIPKSSLVTNQNFMFQFFWCYCNFFTRLLAKREINEVIQGWAGCEF